MDTKVLFEKFQNACEDIEKNNKEQNEIKNELKIIKELVEKLMVKDYSDMLFTEEDVMKILGVGERWLREKRKSGEIGFVPLTNKKIRYKREHIDQYLNKQAKEAFE